MNYRFSLIVQFFYFALCSIILAGCMRFGPPVPDKDGSEWTTITFEATAYCSCQKCTGWERNWYGRPVFSYGPKKGKPKRVGITACGTDARIGTLAADTSRYPFGTWIFIPGYGYGCVEDRGGAIKGNKLDLWFPSHDKALAWGRKRIRCRVLKTKTFIRN